MRLSARLQAVVATGLLLAPAFAFAHEHRGFTVGDKQYSVTIGSMNDPVTVDDKSGVEITVNEIGGEHDFVMEPMADSDEHAGYPVEGLEKTLKVEVQAGDQKKTFDLRATWGEVGSYYAVFYPTVQTTYTYRLFGTINGETFDVPFSCNPAGHPQTEPNNTPVKLSESVTQTEKTGAFGCPASKAELSFPEPAKTLAELSRPTGSPMTAVALALSALALAFSLGAMRKRT